MSSEKLQRVLVSLATVAVVIGGSVQIADADARLFAVSNGEPGEICEIDPITGVEIFSFHTPGPANHPGLALANGELFYSDETLTVIKVYNPDDGSLIREIPKPGDPVLGGAGLGSSSDLIFSVASTSPTGRIEIVDSADGAPNAQTDVEGARKAATYAGPRGSLFVRVDDGGSIKIAEIEADGTPINDFTAPAPLTGLCYSSAMDVLYGVHSGLLYAMDPDTGALVAGYPIQVTSLAGAPVNKTGACAADEMEDGLQLTRTIGYFKNHFNVIDGSFDGEGGWPGFLPLEFCGESIDTACDAIAFLRSRGGGLNCVKRQGMGALLNCNGFADCSEVISNLIADSSAACASGDSEFDYSGACDLLDGFNNSGDDVDLPFKSPRGRPKYFKNNCQ